MKIEWKYKSFEELTTVELYKILCLRNEVFVVEQNCAYNDTDDKDLHCIHLMGNDQDKLVCYCRLVPPGISYSTPSIGRVITAATYRNLGLGKKLMSLAIDKVFDLYQCSEITISAQFYLKKFYETCGFIQVSEIYLEDDIEHIKMILKK